MSEKILIVTPNEPETETPKEQKGIETQTADPADSEEPETQTTEIKIDGKDVPGISLPMAGGIAAALALVSVITTLLLQKLIAKKKIKGKQKEKRQDSLNRTDAGACPEQMSKTPNADTVGKLHNVGRRKGQQDSFGVVNIQRGVCAVVADGMGGLADGDKVSQKIVRTMMQDALLIKDSAVEGTKLYSMAAHANREVNQMLGAAGQYRSGSTMIAVLTEGRYFQWISIGDSRIYLFRGNKLIQMNGEHIYERELLLKAVNSRISFAEANADKQRERLTSFIGMGDLRHIDGSLHPVEAQAGDRIILMSDGVFNTLSEQDMAKVFCDTENAVQAAAILEQWVLARNNPKQDNFTAVILEF